MKAKEYFEELKECLYVDTITVKIDETFNRMVEDLDNLIERRGILKKKYNDEGMVACIKEINNKWRAYSDLWDKFIKTDEATPIQKSITINKNFNEALINLRPQYKKYYPMLESAKYKELMRKYEEERIKEDQEFLDSFNDDQHTYFHRVIPLEDITEENISKEILDCLFSLGNFTKLGLSLECAKPLAARITLLRHWKSDGIDKSEIEEFNKNPFEYSRKYVM